MVIMRVRARPIRKLARSSLLSRAFIAGFIVSARLLAGFRFASSAGVALCSLVGNWLTKFGHLGQSFLTFIGDVVTPFTSIPTCLPLYSYFYPLFRDFRLFAATDFRFLQRCVQRCSSRSLGLGYLWLNASTVAIGHQRY